MIVYLAFLVGLCAGFYLASLLAREPAPESPPEPTRKSWPHAPVDPQLLVAVEWNRRGSA